MITLAQAGLGAWGQNHFRAFSNLKEVYLKIACDKRESVLNNIASAYSGKLKLTLDFNDILADKDVEGVIVATPSATHAELAVKALYAGKHVFVEKPLALNIKDAEAMIKLARKNKRILMVGHLLLYHPAVRQLKLYMEKGILGDLHYMYSTRVNLGQVRAEENALWSLTAHDISVAIYLLGQMPVEASATGKAYIRDKVQDVVFVTLNFRDDIMAHIHAGWLDPHKIRQFTIVGSKKMVVFDDMQNTEKIRIYDKGFDWQRNFETYDNFLTLREGDIHIPKLDMAEPLKLECQHFADCIKKGETPLTDGRNGLAVLKVLTAAQASLDKRGEAVEIE